MTKDIKEEFNLIDKFMELTGLSINDTGTALKVTYITVNTYRKDDSRITIHRLGLMMNFLRSKRIKATLEFDSKKGKMILIGEK